MAGSTGLPGLFAERDPSSPSGPGEEHEHCAVNLHGQLRATEHTLLNSLVQGVKGETGIYQFQLVPR